MIQMIIMGTILLNFPMSLLQKSVPDGTPGFEVIIAGGTIADPENITENDEIVVYYRDILLSSSVITEWGGEEYTFFSIQCSGRG